MQKPCLFVATRTVGFVDRKEFAAAVADQKSIRLYYCPLEELEPMQSLVILLMGLAPLAPNSFPIPCLGPVGHQFML